MWCKPIRISHPQENINVLRDHPIIHVQFGFNQISTFYAFLNNFPICSYVKAVSCASEVKNMTFRTFKLSLLSQDL